MTGKSLFVAAIILVQSLPGAAATASSWWNADWRARVRIEVDAGGYARMEKPVEVPIDFTTLLALAGLAGGLDEASLRLVEIDRQGKVLVDKVPFQFDRNASFDPVSNAAGQLVFLCTGYTGATQIRIYELYFDVEEFACLRPPAETAMRVAVSDGIEHEGQESIKIATSAATYFYHKAGAGFASLEDSDGADWIGYRPCCESGGEYRGIPNLWEFHPGQDSCRSWVEYSGPLRARIRSRSLSGRWECFWDIFPAYARLELVRIDSTYWFLYEGTPGGSLEVDRDYNVISTGLRRSVAEDWHGDLPSPEWVYFGDNRSARVLYLVHHEDDDRSDQFWQMRGEMVVFGFGREYKCCGTYLDRVPARFTLGFAEDSSFGAAAAEIESAWRPLAVKLGTPERLRE